MGLKLIRNPHAACFVASLLTCLVDGCAPVPRTENASAVSRADALLPTGKHLFAFDFARARYQRLPLAKSPADSGAACRVIDSVRAGWPDPDGWLALPTASRPFAPMQAVWGPSGNFFLLDRAGKRLSLYDTNAQSLSGIPLPAEIRDRNLESFQVFWTRDGSFSFLDRDAGRVWQYAEIRAAGGHGDWRLRNSVRLPVDLGPCLWEPYFREPCCLAGKRGGGGTCFDIYFNRIGPYRAARDPDSAGADFSGIRALPASGDWMVKLEGGPTCASPPVCHASGGGALATCPADLDPAIPK